MGRANVLYSFFIHENFRTEVGFTVVRILLLACPEAKRWEPVTVLPSSRLVTRPRKLIITLVPQYKDERTANLTKYNKKAVKPKWITDNNSTN